MLQPCPPLLQQLACVENQAHENRLQAIRTEARDKTVAATCLRYGPRFLCSIGQTYEGENSGAFLQVACSEKGQKFTFGVVKAAQARGDFQVLAERGRRALRVHLSDVESGLKTLQNAVTEALG